MGVLQETLQDLHTRADSTSTDSKSTGWGTMQIVTPIAVGIGLILLFAAYIIWQRRRGSSLGARPMRWNGFVSKFERVFSSPGRRVRHRVTRSTGLVTLDDSMASPGVRVDFQHISRQYSADSTDSSTPLTRSAQNDDYSLIDDPSSPKNRKNRRWSHQFLRLIGLGPQEVKSGVPCANWRIDVSSTGHGHDASGETGGLQGCAANGGLEGGEDDDFDMDRVIAIGDANFSSIASTTSRATTVGSSSICRIHTAPAVGPCRWVWGAISIS
ncbi:hypothetical protein SCLCIDRAFT_713112 [Scleroderma citrinum Foug A]|uniref:Uncharacterized protein n=1 Tax=Scleroderma citrinum Foug A TaxID=1036808 RepID=A0A0C3A7C7_9AGAM|nr:hypothetical protein SCLCIDRAFT_713112 [Scleroderma citrinum Foug A]